MTNEDLKQWINDNLYHWKGNIWRLNAHLRRESWWSKRGFCDVKNEIFEKTSFLPSDFSIVPRINCIENDIKSYPKCKVCSNPVLYNRGKFSKYCSRKCQCNDVRINPFTDESVKEKMKETYRKNNGKFPFERKSFQDEYARRKPTPESIKKAQETWMNRYGCKNPAMRHIDSSVYELLNDKSYLYKRHVEDKIPLYVLANEMEVDPTTVTNYFSKHGIQARNHGESYKEQQLAKFIESLGVDYYTRDTKIIKPYELDIVIPDHKIAVEFCGLYYHCEKFIDKNYHLKKLNMAENSGYRLITIFEDEWDYNQDKVELYISHQLGFTQEKSVYARKTKVYKVSTEMADIFFNEHHLQGAGKYSICYGLYSNNELVACMGIKNLSNGVFDINRYASNNVVGGFSKLLSAFKKDYDWNKIITFADRRFSNGDLYNKNGFELVKVVPPSYKYTKGLRTFHKFGFRKKHLAKKFSNYNPYLTEVENCRLNGYYRIFDCGLYKFEMAK